MTATGSAAEPRTGLFTTSPVRYNVAPGTPVVLQLEHPAVGRTVRTGDELAYAIHPDSPPGVAIDATSSAERLFDATAAVVDVRFDDGRALSSAAALDQHGIAVEPAAAYRSKRAPVDEWTLVRIDLSQTRQIRNAVRVIVARAVDRMGRRERDLTSAIAVCRAHVRRLQEQIDQLVDDARERMRSKR